MTVRILTVLLITAGASLAQTVAFPSSNGAGCLGAANPGYVATATGSGANPPCAWQTVGAATVDANTLKNAAYISDTGATNSIFGTTTNTFPSVYVAGQYVIVKVANTVTGATQININNIGFVPVVQQSGAAMGSGMLVSGGIYLLAYDGARFQLLGFPVATALKSQTTNVDVSGATAPNIGQVLTATDSSHAHWADPTGAAGGAVYAADTGTQNHIVITPSPAITYTAGTQVVVKVLNTNTGATDLAANGLVAKSVKTTSGADPASGAMTAGGTYLFVYDGVNFQLAGAAGPSGAAGAGYGGTSTSALSVGTGLKTFTTQAGLAYLPGVPVRATSAGTPTIFMQGALNSYSGTTLVIDVSEFGGVGTRADWNLSLIGLDGATGPAGPSGASYSAINAQAGTSYTFVNSDCTKLVTFNNASSVAATLPQAGAGGNFASLCSFTAINLGGGTVTITPNPASSINLGTSLVLATGQGAIVNSDGTNYQAMIGKATAGGGSINTQLDGSVVGTGISALNFVTGNDVTPTVTQAGGVTSVQYAPVSTKWATRDQIQTGADGYCSPSSASSLHYTCTHTHALTAYTAGMVQTMRFDVSGSGGAIDVVMDSLAAKKIFGPDGTTALTIAQSAAGVHGLMIYDGSLDGGAGGWKFQTGGTATSGSGGPTYVLDTSVTANVITIAPSPSISYTDGTSVIVKVKNANSGAVTITANGGASKKVRSGVDGVLPGGAFAANSIYLLTYNSSFDGGAGAFEFDGTGACISHGVGITCNGASGNYITMVGSTSGNRTYTTEAVGANDNVFIVGYQSAPAAGRCAQWTTSGGAPVLTQAPGTCEQVSAVNAQTGTSYTFANTDCTKLITFSNASAIAATLPPAGGGGNFTATCGFQVVNLGGGTLTVTSTSTMNGALTYALTTGQGALFVSDGTNYVVQNGKGTGGASSVNTQLDGSVVGTGITALNFVTGSDVTPTVTQAGGVTSVQYAPVSTRWATRDQIQTGADGYCSPASASSTVYTCTHAHPLTAYATGMTQIMRFDVGGSGGAITVTMDSLAAKKIFGPDGTTALTTAQSAAGVQGLMIYDGSLDGGTGGWKFQTGGSSSSGSGTAYAADSGTANAITATAAGFTFTAGSSILIKMNASNAAGTTTATINGTSKNVKTMSIQDPPADALHAGGVYLLVYDGTQLQLEGTANCAMTSTGISCTSVSSSSVTLGGSTSGQTTYVGPAVGASATYRMVGSSTTPATAGDCMQWASVSGNIVAGTAGAPCGSGSGTAISGGPFWPIGPMNPAMNTLTTHPGANVVWYYQFVVPSPGFALSRLSFFSVFGSSANFGTSIMDSTCTKIAGAAATASGQSFLGFTYSQTLTPGVYYFGISNDTTAGDWYASVWDSAGWGSGMLNAGMGSSTYKVFAGSNASTTTGGVTTNPSSCGTRTVIGDVTGGAARIAIPAVLFQ